MNRPDIIAVIARIDQLLQTQLRAILSHPRLQALQASWLGVYGLVQAKRSNKNLKIKLLPITLVEVCNDLQRAIEFDQSHLFNKFYAAEYGSPGGEPYGLLLADYQLPAKQPLSLGIIELLQALTQVAAASFSPLIIGIHPGWFGLDRWEQLQPQLDFSKLIKQQWGNAWQQFRRQTDSRFLGLIMPDVLLRPAKAGKPAIWGNAVFAYGQMAIKHFIDAGWFAKMRGHVPTSIYGGATLDWPRRNVLGPYDRAWRRLLTALYCTDSMEQQLSVQGLLVCKDQPQLGKMILYNNVSCYQGAGQSDDDRIAGMLQYILCVCRFVHVVKIMMRNKVGSFITVQAAERYLERWLQGFIDGHSNESLFASELRPLRCAKVAMTQQPSQPGHYYCTIYLEPHYQIDGLKAELKLETEIAY